MWCLALAADIGSVVAEYKVSSSMVALVFVCSSHCCSVGMCGSVFEESFFVPLLPTWSSTFTINILPMQVIIVLQRGRRLEIICRGAITKRIGECYYYIKIWIYFLRTPKLVTVVNVFLAAWCWRYCFQLQLYVDA